MRHTPGQIGEAVNDVVDEAYRAAEKFPNFNSAHEGYAVIFEEVDELWDHVKGDTGYSDEAYAEAKQIAAMGIRYMVMVRGRQMANTPRGVA